MNLKGNDPFKPTVSWEFRDQTACSELSVRVRIHASSERDKGALYPVWRTLTRTSPPTEYSGPSGNWTARK